MINNKNSSYIPQCNPKAAYLSHKKEILFAIRKVLSSGRYILGQEVELFEKEFADFLKIKYAVAVASGTDAIELILRAYGVGPGDHVITVSHTAVATVAAICRTGASPLFCDINIDDFCISLNSLFELIKIVKKKKLKVKAIIPVHLYGHPADMKAITKIAMDNNMLVIEDCAQAHGTKIDNKYVGTFGDAGAFSFYPTKNLGAIGDAGMIVTNSASLAEKLRYLREYGWKKRYISFFTGVNSRLDEIQAAILRIKLKYLEEDNRKRINIARKYNELLKETNLILPKVDKSVNHVYHQYVIRSFERNKLQKKLLSYGIQTLIHYPLAVHQQPAYKKNHNFVPLISTEKVVTQILSLPIFPELTEEAIIQIVEAIKN